MTEREAVDVERVVGDNVRIRRRFTHGVRVMVEPSQRRVADGEIGEELLRDHVCD